MSGRAGTGSRTLGVEQPLWPGVAPGSDTWAQHEEVVELGGEERVRNVVVPTLTIFGPHGTPSTGAGVVVAPGGGFHMLSWHSEGVDLARWFAARGVTAFVLKYRLARTGPSREDFEQDLARMARRILAPPSEDRPSLLPGIDGAVIELAVADGRRALQLVRGRSADFGVDPNKVAMVGFSAGAVLTVQAAVAKDPEERPDLAVVVYGGALSGPVPDDAPPALFIAAADDPLLGLLTGVHAAWQAAGRPTELHLYEQGGHGFGMQRRGLPVDSWPDRMWEWLESHRFSGGGSG